MACLTKQMYWLKGCTDADKYGKKATTVDFQLSCANNPAGAYFNYTAILQYYDVDKGHWFNFGTKKGSFLSSTKVFSYELKNKPPGYYRIWIDFTQTGASWSMQTTNFKVER